MPTDYVSDFEDLTDVGQVTVTKVIAAPVDTPVKPAKVAEVK